ncbi:MAG: DUF6875 domain-containing protein [Cyanobacteria bacterium P01_B01_bin.77]
MMHLITPSQLKESASSSPLVKTTQWIEGFLAKPHADLGRSGLVCPFVPRSLKLETIQMVELSTQNVSQTEIESLVKECRELFLKQFPQQGKLAIYKALLLVFPDIQDEQCDVIDRVQQTLKPFFVEKGLMLGEFHRFNQSPGLHNPDFRPLQSPVPMLAIRFMTEADLPFLSRVTDCPRVRVKYLESYLDQMTTIVASTKLTTAKHALAQARYEAQISDRIPESIQLTSESTSESISKCPVKRLGAFLQQTSVVVRNSFERAQKRLQNLLRQAVPKLLGLLLSS